MKDLLDILNDALQRTKYETYECGTWVELLLFEGEHDILYLSVKEHDRSGDETTYYRVDTNQRNEAWRYTPLTEYGYGLMSTLDTSEDFEELIEKDAPNVFHKLFTVRG